MKLPVLVARGGRKEGTYIITAPAFPIATLSIKSIMIIIIGRGFLEYYDGNTGQPRTREPPRAASLPTNTETTQRRRARMYGHRNNRSQKSSGWLRSLQDLTLRLFIYYLRQHRSRSLSLYIASLTCTPGPSYLSLNIYPFSHVYSWSFFLPLWLAADWFARRHFLSPT